MNEWLYENPQASRTIAKFILLGIAVIGLWLGRKRLLVAIPLTLVALLVAAVVLPSLIGARPTAQRNACINNLREIQYAKRSWFSLSRNSTNEAPALMTFGIDGEAGIREFLRRAPVCPGGGTYSFGDAAQLPTCSLSRGGHLLKE